LFPDLGAAAKRAGAGHEFTVFNLSGQARGLQPATGRRKACPTDQPIN